MTNPATDVTAEVHRAAVRAHGAHLVSAAQNPRTRAGWLTAVAQALTVNTDELVALAVEETHLTEPRLRNELLRTAFQLELLADEVRSGSTLEVTIDHADPAWGMGPRPDIRRMNVPLGVVGVFGASNFPFAFSVIGGDSASALAAGCAVLHKIHPAHPRLAHRTAEIVGRALAAAGAPDGLFSIVEGHDAGLALVDEPLVKAIGFTGSAVGGRALFDRAAARPEPIPFYGELGSINPVIVLPSAWRRRADDIVAGYAGSFTMGMGQFCTKPGALFVPDDGQDDLGERIGRALAGVALGRLLTPGLRESYAAARDEVAGLDGVEALVSGSDDEVPTPTVLVVDADQVVATPEILRREMFGPASVVVRYRDPADLPALAESLEGQLTAAIHAEDADEADALVRVLTAKAGRVLWNGWPTGVTVSYAQHHGGPYPATTAAGATSVGTASIGRFMRPVAYQDLPDAALPPALREGNPWGVPRRVDGRFEPVNEGVGAR
jgi:NADP-dependent aldehyde dehydrogenase